jgi:hypothetical protein
MPHTLGLSLAPVMLHRNTQGVENPLIDALGMHNSRQHVFQRASDGM